MLHKSSFFLLFAVLTCGQIASAGNCHNVRLMSRFDWKAFEGVWYIHSQTDSEPGVYCVYNIFKAMDNNIMGIEVAGFKGSDTPYSFNRHCKKMGPGVLFDTNEKRTYKILGTDYRSYAVMYSCDNVERVWILTREHNANVANAEAVLRGNGISTNSLKGIRQNNCPVTF